MNNSYFDFFPKIYYDINKNDYPVYVSDLTKRFRVREVVMKNAINFYDYYVKEEERADKIAQDVYNDPTLDWLIFMINDIFDPFWEWPMGYYDFNEYIVGKYGSYVTAVETVHHYEKIVQHEEMSISGTRIPERVTIIDLTEYQTIPEVDRRTVDCYRYEQRLNDARRNIKLLEGGYLPRILAEAKLVLGN